MNASLNECIAYRCCSNSGEDGVSRAGNALFNTFGKLGSDPGTSWLGAYSLYFWRLFLALTACAK